MISRFNWRENPSGHEFDAAMASSFGTGGHEFKHWSEIGPSNAPDTAIMEWARNHDYVVFTHDLDYGALLHATRATAPSGGPLAKWKGFSPTTAVKQFLEWLQIHRLGRKRLLDTLLAATYFQAGATSVLTLNARDFTIFGCFHCVAPVIETRQ